MPRAFFISSAGEPSVNTDYFTNVELTGTEPQEVTYTINPKAVWSDGAPITWEDIASQINATSGKDPAYLIAAPNGSERVASVTRGVDDRQAIMTFRPTLFGLEGHVRGEQPAVSEEHDVHPRGVQQGASLNGPRPLCGPISSSPTSTNRASASP